MPLPPHRTARERAAHTSAAAAVTRAQAHTRPAPDDSQDEPWPPSPAAWRTRCRQIREEIEEDRRHG